MGNDKLPTLSGLDSSLPPPEIRNRKKKSLLFSPEGNPDRAVRETIFDKDYLDEEYIFPLLLPFSLRKR